MLVKGATVHQIEMVMSIVRTLKPPSFSQLANINLSMTSISCSPDLYRHMLSHKLSLNNPLLSIIPTRSMKKVIMHPFEECVFIQRNTHFASVGSLSCEQTSSELAITTNFTNIEAGVVDNMTIKLCYLKGHPFVCSTFLCNAEMCYCLCAKAPGPIVFTIVALFIMLAWVSPYPKQNCIQCN